MDVGALQPLFEKVDGVECHVSAETRQRNEPEAENRKLEKCAPFHSLARSALAHSTVRPNQREEMAPPQTQKDATKAVHKPDYDAVRKVSPASGRLSRATRSSPSGLRWV